MLNTIHTNDANSEFILSRSSSRAKVIDIITVLSSADSCCGIELLGNGELRIVSSSPSLFSARLSGGSASGFRTPDNRYVACTEPGVVEFCC